MGRRLGCILTLIAFSQLLQANANDAIARHLFELERFQQHRVADAEQLFLRAIDAGHGIVKPYLNLARKVGNKKEAAGSLEKARALHNSWNPACSVADFNGETHDG